jgi:hypothetical protein
MPGSIHHGHRQDIDALHDRDKNVDDGNSYKKSSMYMSSYLRRYVGYYVPDYMKSQSSHSLL